MSGTEIGGLAYILLVMFIFPIVCPLVWLWVNDWRHATQRTQASRPRRLRRGPPRRPGPHTSPDPRG